MVGSVRGWTGSVVVGDFVVGGILGNWMVGGAGRGRLSLEGLTPCPVNYYRGYG